MTHRWWENSSPSFFHLIKFVSGGTQSRFPPRTAATALCPEGSPSSTASRPAAALWLFLVNTSLQFIDSLLEKQHYIMVFLSLKKNIFFLFCKTNRQDQQERQQNAITVQLKCAVSFLPCEDTAQSHTGIDAEQPPGHDLRSLAWRSENAFQTIAAHSVIVFSL